MRISKILMQGGAIAIGSAVSAGYAIAAFEPATLVAVWTMALVAGGAAAWMMQWLLFRLFPDGAPRQDERS